MLTDFSSMIHIALEYISRLTYTYVELQLLCLIDVLRSKATGFICITGIFICQKVI